MIKSSNGAKLHKITGFSLINDDLLQNITSRLPAVSFASASCVSKSWNKVCRRVLSRPKLVSALSLNPSPRVLFTDFFVTVFVSLIFFSVCFLLRKLTTFWNWSFVFMWELRILLITC